MSNSDSPVDLKSLPKGKFHQLVTLWSFMRPYKLQMFMALFFLVIAASITLSIPYALRTMMDSGFGVTDASAIKDSFYNFGVIVIVLALATSGRFYFITWIGERVVADIRTAVYARLVSMSPEYFEENRPGEIVSRLTADTTLVQSIVGSSLSIWLRNMIIAIGGTIMLAHMSPKLMAYIAAVIPVILVSIIFIGRRVRNLSRSSQDRVADVGAQASETLSALNVVQAFTQELGEVNRFSDRVEDAFKVAKRRIMARSILTAVVISLIFGSIAFVMYQGAVGVAEGSMSGGAIFEFILMAIFVAGAYGALSEMYGDLMRAAGASGRLAELLSVTPKIKAPENPVPVPSNIVANIRFADVMFSYPTRKDVAALDHFNMDVKAGETVALVGPSGAGKSTVLQMLLRFYDPQSGTIHIDGFELTEVAPEDFRRHIAFVPQDTIIFADTVRENIRYGRSDATDEEVREAAKAAAALDFIEDSPEGFDTYLGERGVRLSGGQRQRLAIARAILRNAPILLLDEATSALDAVSERQVQQALEALMTGRTTIVIAHRLATVKKADRIIVMDKGKIVDQGTHQELVAKGGLYKKLADLQFGDDPVTSDTEQAAE